MSRPVLNQTDVAVVRSYRYRGITILIKIDFTTKKISIVERDKGKRMYIPKKWIFNEREADYVRSWVAIMEAMKVATTAALKELDDFKERQFNDLVKSMAEMDGNAKPIKRNKS